MSALPIPNLPLPRFSAGRRHLRAVADRTAHVSRLPFLLILAGVLGIGLLGLVLLNTRLQDQAFEMRQLHREQARLANHEAYLVARVEEVGSPAALAGKASALGMRANTHSVFLVVPDGTLIGEPRPVQGDELPSSVVNPAAPRQATQAAESANQADADRDAGTATEPAESAIGEDAAAEQAAAEQAEADKTAAEQAAAEQDREPTPEEKAAEQQAKNEAEVERARRAATGEGG